MNDDQNVRQLILDMLAAEKNGTVEVPTQTARAAENALDEAHLGLSSLELVRLLVSLERLGIEIDDAAIMNSRFETLDDIVSLVAVSAA
jgi:acyl carrier protein